MALRPSKAAMALLKNKAVIAALTGAALLVGGGVWAWHESREVCCAFPDDQERIGAVGLMTSLPLYWPEGAALGEIASGERELPWQRRLLESRYDLVPLDTLSPIPALDPDADEIDPIGDLDRLAVIQPRGLSPADNVALDNWVRAGGRLLLVLDPALTAHSEYALGDPRRPVDAALIPPVVARWGLEVRFDEAQPPVRSARLGEVELPLELSGEVREIAGSDTQCRFGDQSAYAVCTVGKGRVTLLADAALFALGSADDPEGERRDKSAAIQALVESAFENR